LVKAGHDVTLVTLGAYREIARANGLSVATVDIDPFAFIRGDIGQAWMDSMDNPLRLFAGVSRAAGEVLEKLNEEALAACRGCDALIYNPPLSISGLTIAEVLGVPGIPASVAPFHPTQDFSSIFTPSLPFRSGFANRLSGSIVIQALWLLFRSHMERWRRAQARSSPLPLRPPLGEMRRRGLPWLYGFSPSVIPAPRDWPENTVVCGYWFSPMSPGWRPSRELEDFLDSGPAPIYVGFGSMVGADPERTMSIIEKAVLGSGRRAIVASGWGGMRHGGLPEGIFAIEHVPHEWLFPRVAAAVHHGGAGTTAAALRAGIPSVVVPYFYDQFFWGQRLFSLGVAPRPIPHKKLTEANLEAAIRLILGGHGVRERCAALSARIGAEDGVGTAVSIIEGYLRSVYQRTTR
jgi:UDP:flavonoid glycosyltransferase YjiC (YdhE family)